MVDIAGQSTEARKKPPLSAGRDRRQQNQPCFVPNSPHSCLSQSNAMQIYI